MYLWPPRHYLQDTTRGLLIHHWPLGDPKHMLPAQNCLFTHKLTYCVCVCFYRMNNSFITSIILYVFILQPLAPFVWTLSKCILGGPWTYHRLCMYISPQSLLSLKDILKWTKWLITFWRRGNYPTKPQNNLLYHKLYDILWVQQDQIYVIWTACQIDK